MQYEIDWTLLAAPSQTLAIENKRRFLSVIEAELDFEACAAEAKICQ